MKGLLIRVGIDSKYGHWNSPVDPKTGEFVFTPIPERHEFIPGLETKYESILPFLRPFAEKRHLNEFLDLGFPQNLRGMGMHLDPDFEFLTYGDDGERRGRGVAEMDEGDLIAFYAGLKPITPMRDKLMYALVGLYIVDKIGFAGEVNEDHWDENAHTRKMDINPFDVIVHAKPEFSGRLERAISIGEWRKNAYRVRNDLLDIWGGLSVKDGYITRSIVPPRFLNPEKFHAWFKDQRIEVIQKRYF